MKRSHILFQIIIVTDKRDGHNYSNSSYEIKKRKITSLMETKVVTEYGVKYVNHDKEVIIIHKNLLYAQAAINDHKENIPLFGEAAEVFLVKREITVTTEQADWSNHII